MYSYHGNKERHLYIHTKGNKVPNNLHISGFVDPIEMVCSNYGHVDKNTYICEGHENGDIYYPSYHGHPSKNYSFWVFSDENNIKNPRWQFHEESVPCNNYEL